MRRLELILFSWFLLLSLLTVGCGRKTTPEVDSDTTVQAKETATLAPQSTATPIEVDIDATVQANMVATLTSQPTATPIQKQEDPIIGNWHYTEITQGEEGDILFQFFEDNTFKIILKAIAASETIEGTYEFFEDENTLYLEVEEAKPATLQVEISEDGDTMFVDGIIPDEKLTLKKLSDDELAAVMATNTPAPNPTLKPTETPSAKRDYSNLVFGEVVESDTWALSIEKLSSTRPNDLYILYGVNYAIKNISPNPQYYRLNSLPIELLDGDGYALDSSNSALAPPLPLYVPSGLVVRHTESLRVDSRNDPKRPLKVVVSERFVGSQMIFQSVLNQTASLVSDEERVGFSEPVQFGSIKLEFLSPVEVGLHNEGSLEVSIEWPVYPWVNLEPSLGRGPETIVMAGFFMDKEGKLCLAEPNMGFPSRIPANTKVRGSITPNCPSGFGQLTRLLIFNREGNAIVFELGVGSSTSVSPTVTPSASYDDLYGHWRQENYFLSFGHNRFTGEDARFKFTDAVDINDAGAYELKTTTEWTEIVFVSDADSDSCAGQIGRYKIRLTDEGELHLNKIEDQCVIRGAHITIKPFIRDSN